jgi:hypothetical protein
MTIWHAVLGLIAFGVLGFLGWYSIQSLLQARLLRGWRRPSHAALENSAAAVWGEVRIQRELSIHGLGDCLWRREIVRIRRGKSWSTESDESEKAAFSIVADGHEFHVVDLPTEVHGTSSHSEEEGFELGHLLWDNRRTFTTHWLPKVAHLAVVGFVRRKNRRWEIEKDAAVGLLWSPHHPARSAFWESVKGWAGVAITAAGFVAMAILLFEMSP